MVTNITSTVSGDTTSPALVLGWEFSRRGGSIVHRVLGSSAVDVTLRPAALRSGTLNLFYLTEAPALACEAMHAKAARFTITDSDRPALGMQYVVTGQIRVTLDPETMKRWLVAVDFEQVL